MSAGQYVVPVRCVANSVDRRAFLVDRAPLVDDIAFSCEFKSISLEMGEVGSDLHACSVVPRAFAD